MWLLCELGGQEIRLKHDEMVHREQHVTLQNTFCNVIVSVEHSAALLCEISLERRVLMASSSSQYDTDFYVLDKYPLAVRPFYTMPDPNNLVSLSHTRCQRCCFSAICIHAWYEQKIFLLSIFTMLSVVNLYGALWFIWKSSLAAS